MISDAIVAFFGAVFAVLIGFFFHKATSDNEKTKAENQKLTLQVKMAEVADEAHKLTDDELAARIRNLIAEHRS